MWSSIGTFLHAPNTKHQTPNTKHLAPLAHSMTFSTLSRYYPMPDSTHIGALIQAVSRLLYARKDGMMHMQLHVHPAIDFTS